MRVIVFPNNRLAGMGSIAPRNATGYSTDGGSGSGEIWNSGDVVATSGDSFLDVIAGAGKSAAQALAAAAQQRTMKTQADIARMQLQAQVASGRQEIKAQKARMSGTTKLLITGGAVVVAGIVAYAIFRRRGR
jgi:hypothetical protein